MVEAAPLPKDGNLLEPRVVRPGEQSDRIIFADPDIASAEDFAQLAEQSPQAAARVLARMAPGETRDARLYELMQIWVDIDPNQAAEWVVNLPFGELKNDATAELGLTWGTLDPAATAQWVEENIFTENAPAGAASLTSAWARADFEAATEWIETLDVDSPARKEAMKTLANQLGELDPVRGLSWIGRLDEEDRNLIAVNFAASWSDHDPRAAANWLRFQAGDIDPGTRDLALLAAIHTWAADETKAANAGRWIDGLADGQLKENAKATFAETHAETSPIEALPWAQDIKDEERRREVSLIVLEEWILGDMDEFKTEIGGLMGDFDKDLRHEVYELLLDHDPEFKDELFAIVDSLDSPDEIE